MVRGLPRVTHLVRRQTSVCLDCRTYDLGLLLLDLTQQNTVELNLGELRGWQAKFSDGKE